MSLGPRKSPPGLALVASALAGFYWLSILILLLAGPLLMLSRWPVIASTLIAIAAFAWLTLLGASAARRRRRRLLAASLALHQPPAD